MILGIAYLKFTFAMCCKPKFIFFRIRFVKYFGSGSCILHECGKITLYSCNYDEIQASVECRLRFFKLKAFYGNLVLKFFLVSIVHFFWESVKQWIFTYLVTQVPVQKKHFWKIADGTESKKVSPMSISFPDPGDTGNLFGSRIETRLF
jgi:hypothetical protein